MSGGFNLDDYVDVAERIRLFYEKYPDGRLGTVAHGMYPVGERTFVYCQAHAHRTPDDPQPCVGTAWEPIPGPTPYTKDSELMNAETAAWGRAIIAAGIPSKKIASQQEVQARQPEKTPAAKRISPGQSRNIHRLEGKLQKDGAPHSDKYPDWETFRKAYTVATFGKESSKDLTTVEAGTVIDWLEEHERVWAAQVEAESIPF